MTLTFTFDHERREFTRATLVLSRGLLARQLGIWGSIWLLGVLVMLALDGVHGPGPLFGAALVLWVVLMVVGQRRTIRTRFDSAPAMREEQTYEFSDAGITVRNVLAKHEYLWPGVLRAYETDEFFFFYVTTKAALFLSKRVMQGVAEPAALRALVAEQMQRLGRPFKTSVK